MDTVRTAVCALVEMATLPTDTQNIWVTAASDESRTTVLLSQWHTRLEDATGITFPMRITGLVDGAYQVDIEWIEARTEITPGFKTMLVDLQRIRLTVFFGVEHAYVETPLPQFISIHPSIIPISEI